MRQTVLQAGQEKSLLVPATEEGKVTVAAPRAPPVAHATYVDGQCGVVGEGEGTRRRWWFGDGRTFLRFSTTSFCSSVSTAPTSLEHRANLPPSRRLFPFPPACGSFSFPPFPPFPFTSHSLPVPLTLAQRRQEDPQRVHRARRLRPHWSRCVGGDPWWIRGQGPRCHRPQGPVYLVRSSSLPPAFSFSALRRMSTDEFDMETAKTRLRSSRSSSTTSSTRRRPRPVTKRWKRGRRGRRREGGESSREMQCFRFS